MRGLLVLFLTVLLGLYGGAPDTLWTAHYGIQDHDEAWCVRQTSDGGFIMAGAQYPNDNNMYDVYIVKTDASGNLEWEKTYGGSAMWEFATQVEELTNGGYMVAAMTEDPNTMQNVFWLMILDSLGDTLWTKTYGGGSGEYCWAGQPTSDGGYILVGVTYSYGAGGADIWVVKTDSAGDTLWTRAFGGSVMDEGYGVCETSDGGFAVVGVTQSFGAGSEDAYILRLDSNGDTLWTRTFGTGSNEDAKSVRQTNDGGFIVVGKAQGGGAGGKDVYLMRVSADGDSLWAKRIGGANDDIGWEVWVCDDGGFFITGETDSYNGDSTDTEMYLVRTDSLGDTLWTTHFGGVRDDWGKSGVQTADGGYAATGALYINGETDFYLVRLNRETGVEVIPETNNLKLSVGKSPFTWSTDVVFFLPCYADVKLDIFNPAGQKVKTLASGRFSPGRHSVVWNGENYLGQKVPSGVYILRLVAGGTVRVEKITYVR